MTGIYGRESMAERLGITRGLEVSSWSGGIIYGDMQGELIYLQERPRNGLGGQLASGAVPDLLR